MTMKQKLILAIFMLLLGVVCAQAQGAGLSQGVAVKSPTNNPTKETKSCSQCGITMGNVTYAWQHEIWCPYYKSKGTSAARSSGVSQENVVTGVVAATVGSVLGNALSNWLNSEPKDRGDYRRYDNSNLGQALNYGYDKKTGKKVPEYVVMRSSKTGKIGVWRNGWTYYGTHYKDGREYPVVTDYPGLWLVKPKYDFVTLRNTGHITYAVRENCIPIVGVKSGKGENAEMKYGVLEPYTYNGAGRTNELIPLKYDSFVATTPDKSNPLMIILGNKGTDGKMVWGVWKLKYKEKNSKYNKLEVVQILTEQFSEVQIYDCQYIAAKKDGKYGLYDSDGKCLMPHVYANLKVFRSGLVLREEGGKYGVIKQDGTTILPCEYEQIDEMCWTRKNGEKVSSLFVMKDGERYYASNGRLISVHAPVDFEACNRYYDTLMLKGMSFPSWYEKKTAKLREEFMQRGEFEKEADYKARIADPANLGKFLSSKIPNPQDDYLSNYDLKKNDKVIFGRYDTENECFPLYLKQSPWDVVRIPVPIDAAPEFGKNYKRGTLELKNDFPAIKSVVIELRNGIGEYVEQTISF